MEQNKTIKLNMHRAEWRASADLYISTKADFHKKDCAHRLFDKEADYNYLRKWSIYHVKDKWLIALVSDL